MSQTVSVGINAEQNGAVICEYFKEAIIFDNQQITIAAMCSFGGEN